MSTVYACSNSLLRHGGIAARKDYAITGSSGHAHALAGKEWRCAIRRREKPKNEDEVNIRHRSVTENA